MQLTLAQVLPSFEPIKKCKACGELKPLDQFNKHKRYKDGLQEECRECNKKYKRDYYLRNKERLLQEHREYNKKNKEKIAKQRKEYLERNRSWLSERWRQYNREHKHELKIYRIKYRAKNKEMIAKKDKLYNMRNREKVAQRKNEYNKTLIGKMVKHKVESKRRLLGFNPINNYFEGSHYHHLRYDSNGNKDNDIGIFIPAELHQSVGHNGSTGYGMEKINKLAIGWYLTTCNSNHEELLKLGFNSIEEFVERYKPSN